MSLAMGSPNSNPASKARSRPASALSTRTGKTEQREDKTCTTDTTRTTRRISARRRNSNIVSEPRLLPKENQMLYPDEYFKDRICLQLGVDRGWLEETNAKFRFRQNFIEQIQNSERNSARATKILRDYLMVKHRDKPEQRDPTAKKYVAQQARKEMAFKALQIHSKLSEPFAKMICDVDRRKKLSRGVRPAAQRNVGGVRPQSTTAPKDQGKALVSAAEELQHEILELEKTVGRDRNSQTKERERAVSEAWTSRGDTPRKQQFQGLADSILLRGRRETYIKSTEMVRGALISSCLSLVKSQNK